MSHIQVDQARVGAVNKSMYETMYNTWFPDNNNLISYDTQDECFTALENGDIDLLMTSEIMLLTQTNFLENPDYKVNVSFDSPIASVFGFSKNEELLCSIINKAQDFVDVDSIATSWSNRTFDYEKKLATERSSFLLRFVVALFFILLIVVWLLLKNRWLSRNLERQTAALSTIYTSIPDMVFCKDINGVYTSCNPSFEKFAGCSEAEIIGKNDIQIFKIDEKMARFFIETDQKTLKENSSNVVEEWVTFPDNSHKLLETIKTPLVQKGSVIGMMGISRDITRRKMAEDAAHVASQAKSSFLAHMSHEIRTPLTAIMGMANIAKNSISNQNKVLASISQIISSSNHLLDILNNVLDMSKIESGKLELTHEAFSLLDAYDEVFGIINQRCVEKNIRFVTNISEMKDITLIGDKLRVNQVLINLLGNSVKFTDAFGDIKFEVSILEESDTKVCLEYSIFDNGIGMSKEQMSKLFVPFEQGDSSVAAKFGGTGLGLSISQNIIKMMGGIIEVESELNVGTKFHFKLYFDKSATIIKFSSETPDSLDLNGKRILLVEDVGINRIIICELLSSTGVEIHEAEDGQQAIEIYERSPMGYFDLIFMDVQMPVIDGYEATRRIRASTHEDAKRIPIIAMTANAYKEDVDQSLSAGMNDHLSKPIDIVAMTRVLRRFIAPKKD